jgi:hypothetical protein
VTSKKFIHEFMSVFLPDAIYIRVAVRIFQALNLLL